MTGALPDSERNTLRPLFAALMQADLDKYRAALADDAVVWHNYNEHEQTLSEHLAAVQDALTTVQTMEIKTLSAVSTDDVRVEQLYFTNTLQDGRVIRFPGCIVARFRHGLIYRLDEYIDTAAIAAQVGA